MSNISGGEPVHHFKQPYTDTVNNEILHQTRLYGKHYIHSHDVNLQDILGLEVIFTKLNSTSESSITSSISNEHVFCQLTI